jgi:hypothetical protein
MDVEATKFPDREKLIYYKHGNREDERSFRLDKMIQL